MKPSLTFRTLCAVWALLLLAAPTMALCVECVSGVCGEPAAVHDHERTAETDAHGKHRAVVEAGMGHGAETTATGAAAEHCNGPAASQSPAPNAASTPAASADAAPSVGGDCCIAQSVLVAEEVATRSASLDTGVDVLALTSVSVPLEVVETTRVADRSGGPISRPPLFRLHASLLL